MEPNCQKRTCRATKGHAASKQRNITDKNLNEIAVRNAKYVGAESTICSGIAAPSFAQRSLIGSPAAHTVAA